MSKMTQAEKAKAYGKLRQYLNTYGVRLLEDPEERSKELDEFIKTGKLKRVRTMGR